MYICVVTYGYACILCLYADTDDKGVSTGTTIATSVGIGVVVLVIVIALVVYCVTKMSRKNQIHTTETVATVPRTNTLVAVAVPEDNSAPMAKETGIRPAIIVNAEIVMPSITPASTSDSVNLPVATARFQEETASLPTATATVL